MKIVNSIMTKNPCYTEGRKIAVKGLMLHSVGCAQPKASVFINGWNKSTYTNACVHAFIDALDGNVYQTLPWNHRAWHCGASGNNTHIGVEMCEPDCITYTAGSTFSCSNLARAQQQTKRTYDAAVELFTKLCTDYGLDPTAAGVIVSHKEGHARGIASNHGDPEHLWNQLGMGYTMDGFRRDVASKMGKKTTTASSASTTKKNSAQTTFIKAVQKACGAKVDGIAGSETLSKTVTVSYSVNDKHVVVKPIQTYLNKLGYSCGTADGEFGYKTKAAVIKFQKANGCVTDGIITKGAKTWKKLLGMS